MTGMTGIAVEGIGAATGTLPGAAGGSAAGDGWVAMAGAAEGAAGGNAP